MKNLTQLFILSLVQLSALTSNAATQVQYIDCISLPVSVTNQDKVIVSLKTPTTGTLFLSSGIDHDGNHDNSGVLKLEKNALGTTSMTASFKAENQSSTFEFLLPANLIFKRTNEYFNATLRLQRKDGMGTAEQDLNCFTRLYDAS